MALRLLSFAIASILLFTTCNLQRKLAPGAVSSFEIMIAETDLLDSMTKKETANIKRQLFTQLLDNEIKVRPYYEKAEKVQLATTVLCDSLDMYMQAIIELAGGIDDSGHIVKAAECAPITAFFAHRNNGIQNIEKLEFLIKNTRAQMLLTLDSFDTYYINNGLNLTPLNYQQMFANKSVIEAIAMISKIKSDALIDEQNLVLYNFKKILGCS